jgi:succinate dehydrogenase/fumarate reductase flavoprotein subunit
VAKTARRSELRQMAADVLVVGGGPAATWAAVAAAEAGASVILVDKGYVGTSGATAPANTGTWSPPPGERRHAAISARQPRTGNLADLAWVERTLDTAWNKLQQLGDWGYPFPRDDDGNLYRANLRGPDYMHFMRRRALRSGVEIFDQHPALELLGDGHGVAGANGVDRQSGRSWQVRAGAVVLATGGCAFGERMLGAAALTGDGYLMAAEAGAVLSGMEFSSQYATAPKPSALNKGLPFAWASFFREDGSRLETEGKDRYTVSPRRCWRDRSTRDTTKRGPNCSNGSGRASQTAFCRSTAALSIRSPSAGRLPCGARARCAGLAASG